MDVATVSISESRTFTVTVTEYERLIEENARLRYENEFLSRENQELKLSEEKTKREFEEAYRSSLIREQERMCALENYRVSGHMQYQHTRWSAMPHEIVVQIMDYLDQQDDKKTLLRCALVCRSWASSSRKYTFTSLTVSLWTSGARRLRLYGLLDHPLCTFASAVRTLRIDADSNERYGAYAGWLDPLIPCLHKLSAVQHLDCTPITEWHSQSAWRALLRTHTFTAQIVDLTLRGVAFDSIEAFVETIQSFPLLVHLKYEGEHSSVARNTWGDSLPSLPYWKPLPNLRSLEIAQSFLPWSRLVWRWLHISQTRPSILSLDAVTLNDFMDLHQINNDHSLFRRGEQFRSLESFSQYLQYLGPALEVLKINFRFSHPDTRHGYMSIPLFLENVDLSPVVGLRLLDLIPLEVHFLPEDLHITHGSTLVPIFLSRMPRQERLSEIIFEIREAVYPEDVLDEAQAESDEAWRSLDTLLIGPSFPALKDLTFRLPVSRKWFDDMFLELELLGRKLPRCQTKFRLRTFF